MAIFSVNCSFAFHSFATNWWKNSVPKPPAPARLPSSGYQNPNAIQIGTGSKVALIELLYALHAEGTFNFGTSDLKDVVEFFEQTLKIDLGQYHRAYLEIRIRKTNRTKFLNTLKETLTKRMDNSDE